MKLKKIFYVILGCAGVALGALGAVLPLLPAFPFLLLAAFCFARSSEKLHNWFTGTKLYKNNLESYVKGRGMTPKTKVKIMVTVTLLMSVGFIMMDQVPVGRVVLACVWIFHILYFMLGVKTIKSVRTVRSHTSSMNALRGILEEHMVENGEGLSGNDIFQPHFPKKTSPAEFRAFRHGLFCGRCLFPCCSSHFRAQKPLVADFGSALFPMRPSPRFFLRIYVFYRAENGGICLCSGQLHTA